MKNQALFSLKDKSKKLKCRLLQFLFGALRVNEVNTTVNTQQLFSTTEGPRYNDTVCYQSFCC